MEIIRSERTRSRKQKAVMQTLTTLGLCLIASWKLSNAFLGSSSSIWTPAKGSDALQQIKIRRKINEIRMRFYLDLLEGAPKVQNFSFTFIALFKSVDQQ